MHLLVQGHVGTLDDGALGGEHAAAVSWIHGESLQARLSEILHPRVGDALARIGYTVDSGREASHEHLSHKHAHLGFFTALS